MIPLSIYIHWAFCKSKCPYCDFNSHVRDSVDHTRWQNALLKELQYYAELLPDREIVSIFFGGGTPSLMEVETVASLIEFVGKNWKVADNIEITLEANPTSFEAAKFKGFRDAGVNRVSIGIQSLNDENLKFLGRQHNTNEALQTLEIASEIFPRISFDLIYAIPNQTLANWESELKQSLKYAKDHISLYQLTIEENTAFHHIYKNGGFVLPEEGLASDMYLLTQEITEAHNLPAYEISNHARLGSESRHNLAYWRCHDYIGIGAGAHGRYSLSSDKSWSAATSDQVGVQPARRMSAIKRIANENIKSPERWLENIERHTPSLQACKAGVAISGDYTTARNDEITAREQIDEIILMGLRLREGIKYADYPVNLREFISPSAIKKLSDLSLIIADNEGIRTTPEGRLLLNSVVSELVINQN